MTVDYDGDDLIDSAGDKVGTVERTYVDDNGQARFLAVKIGTLMAKHRLVPAEDAQEDEGGVRVSYLRDVIEESPSVDSGDTLEGDALDEVRGYYQGVGAPASNVETNSDDLNSDDESRVELADATTVAAIAEVDQRHRPASDFPDVPRDDTPADFGQVRDLGDVIEVPIVEEVMVKKPIVREVLRIRKSQLTEQGTAAADLRSEHVEVVSTGSGLVTADSEIEETDD